MDVLDKQNKGLFILLDKCSIHRSHFVVDVIKKRGYKPLFIPPYSPFLNPIEERWPKIKKLIRNPLDQADTLTPRIAKTYNQITIEDCKG